MTEAVFGSTLLGHILDDNSTTVLNAFDRKDAAAIEAHPRWRTVLASPLDFDALTGRGLAAEIKQSGSRARIADNVGGQVHGHQLVCCSVPKHGDQGLVDIQKMAGGVELADSVGTVLDQRAIMCFRAAQGFFGLVALLV